MMRPQKGSQRFALGDGRCGMEICKHKGCAGIGCQNADVGADSSRCRPFPVGLRQPALWSGMRVRGGSGSRQWRGVAA